MDAEGGSDPRRGIPSVEHVLADLDPTLPHAARADVARAAVDSARRGARGREDVLREAKEAARVLSLGLLDRVVNATGVLLHTNLGRAPLGADALDAMTRATGYTNVEYRLAEGVRGSRHEHAGALLARACGAEAGIVVNNNAAAVLLVLPTLRRRTRGGRVRGRHRILAGRARDRRGRQRLRRGDGHCRRERTAAVVGGRSCVPDRHGAPARVPGRRAGAVDRGRHRVRRGSDPTSSKIPPPAGSSLPSAHRPSRLRHRPTSAYHSRSCAP